MLSGVGIAIGAAVAAGIARWMSLLLFGVTPVDAVTFAVPATVMALAALAQAICLPTAPRPWTLWRR
jgi:predicted lysophospholipase L1 biosynthesis ABC-type transport system permease subunit